MSSTFRVSRCVLALSLSLVNLVSAQPQSKPSIPSSPSASDEAAVREVAQQYFALYAAESLDGVLSLWSEKSPDYAQVRQDLPRQFAAEDFSFSNPLISRSHVDGERAGLRLMTNLVAVNPKSGRKREERLTRNFAFVREEGKWKVWRSVPAEEDLADELVKARTEAERTALLAAEKELVTVHLASALRGRASHLHGRGEYQQALALSTLSQSISEQLGDRLELWRTLLLIGHVHRSLGNHARAMEYFQKSLAITEALGDQTGIGILLMGMGMVNSAQGNYTEAWEQFEKSLALFKSLNDKNDISRVLSNMGNIKRYQGDYAQALDYFQQALAINRDIGFEDGILNNLGNLGVVYSSLGNYAQALDAYRQSLAMSEATDDKEGIAITTGNIGVLYRKQGNYAQALEYYRKSLAMSESIEDKVGIAQMLNNIGTVYHKQGEQEQALDYFRKSLAMRETLGDKYGSAGTLMAIGTAYTSQGDYAQAMEYYQKSLAIMEAIGTRDGVARVQNAMAIDLNRQGRYQQALDLAERATALARQVGEPSILANARFQAGRAYRALNQSDQARRAFEETIALTETMRSQVAGGGQDQQRFFEDKISPYYAMVDLLAAQNEPTAALIFAERAKARALLDVLYSGHVNIVKAMTPQEQEQEHSLRAELSSLNTQVTRASQQDKADPTRLSELKSSRESVRLKYEAFQTSLYAAHPELRTQRGEAPVINARELSALLPDAASALVEYVVASDQTYLFVVTKAAGKAEAEVHFYRLPIKRDELAKQIEAFRGQLAARDLGFRAAALKLHDLLLKPAADQLRGKSNLVIAADDQLWDLPFQALLTGANRFLIEDATIAYAPSFTVLREMAKRRRNQGADTAPMKLLALGNPLLGKETMNRASLILRDEQLDPLPEAEQEVKALRQLYGVARSKVYIGPEAREDRVKAEAGQASILHFAAHGTLNNASPMYSYLALVENGAHEDGLLEAWELTQLNLKADLAVLSACETARGRVGAGEGMIGLSWAMFVAGVPSIVVSQWKVESASTRDLMLNFHRNLISGPAGAKAGPTKAEALRQAALKLMKNPETSHPFYWAGFVLVGDER